MLETLPLAPASPTAVTGLLLADVTLLSWLPTIAMFAGILALGSAMMVFFNRRERQLKAIAVQISSDLEEARALRQQLDEAHTLASNMMVTAQRLSARLDERVAALDMASLRMNATRNALPKAPAPPHTPRPAMTKPHARTTAGNVQTSHASNEHDLALSPMLSSIATAMAPAAARSSVEMKPNVDAFTRQVYDLADAGQPAMSIAQDLNEHVGKVELILALRSR